LLERAPRGDCVLATVVATAGSTYRKPGARMLIMADGSFCGLLSGGCLEADLRIHAREVLASGVARAVEYDMRGPDDILFGIGAGCEGAMRVLLEPAGPATPAAAALANAGLRTRTGGAASLVSVHESEEFTLGTYDAAALARAALASAALAGAALDQSAPAPAVLAAAAERALTEAASQEVEFGTGGRRGRAFAQFLAPPPHLLLCGAGPDAEPVASTAVRLGWRVTVVDHRPAYAVAQHFPGAAVRLLDAHALRAAVALEDCHAAVVMSHHLPSDVAYLRALPEAGAPDYVGVLGPAARRRRILQELGGTAVRLRARLRGPVGSDIGAVTPEGIALAIVSEIHAWLAGRAHVMLDSFG
jgi:xanthine/CO dehydrogenase XdhC/CoxF family maturation factor